MQAFVAQIDRELVFAQVLIRRVEPGHELRHVADRDHVAKALRELRLSDLRQLARFTASGAFRPLKAAPSLSAGWRLRVKDAAALDTALDQLYPGTIADWFAAQSVTLAMALRTALAHPDTTLREADFNAPGNPRRIQLLLEKIQPLAAAGEVSAEE